MNNKNEIVVKADISRLTIENKDAIIKMFLRYADDTHYEGEYSFSAAEGLHLDWGKYGYSVEESEQDKDEEMLIGAAELFNKDCKGMYFAFTDWTYKIIPVYIVDLLQLRNHPYCMEEAQRATSKELQQAYKIIRSWQDQKF